MTALPERRQLRSLFPMLSDLWAGFPSGGDLRPLFDTNLMRLEDETKEGRYELRAEMPGIDPAKDVEISVRNGVVTIKAEREEKKESEGRSEFQYGSFIRSVTLPPGADEDDITATYDKGILTVSVKVKEAKPAEKRIEIVPKT